MARLDQLPFDVLRLIIFPDLPRPAEAHLPDNIRSVCRLVRILTSVSSNIRAFALSTPEALAFLDCTTSADPKDERGLTPHALAQHLQLSAPNNLHILLDPRRDVNGGDSRNDSERHARILLGSPAIVERWASLTVEYYTWYHENWLCALQKAGIVFPALHTIHVTGSLPTCAPPPALNPQARDGEVLMTQVFPALHTFHMPVAWTAYCMRLAWPVPAFNAAQTWIDVEKLPLTRLGLEFRKPLRLYEHTYSFPALVALRLHMHCGYYGESMSKEDLVHCFSKIRAPQISFLDLCISADTAQELDLSGIAPSFPLLTTLSIRCNRPLDSFLSQPVASFKGNYPLLTRIVLQGFGFKLADENSKKIPLKYLYLSSFEDLEPDFILHFLNDPHCLIEFGPSSDQDGDATSRKELVKFVHGLDEEMSSRLNLNVPAPDRLINALFYSQT